MVPRSYGFYKRLLDNLHDGITFVDQEGHIIYWNRGAERLSGYVWDDVDGKSYPEMGIFNGNRTEDPSEHPCPVILTLSDGETREAELLLCHKEGHRVPVWVRVAPVHDISGAVVGAVEVFSDNSSRVEDLKQISELEKQALLCPLTGLGNRRNAQILLRSRLDEFNRYGWRFGLLSIDIDFFKRVNDEYGHDVGDLVLRAVSKTLEAGLRTSDFMARWGGEEFLGILTNVGKEELHAVAERCRSMTEKAVVHTEVGDVCVSVSIGACLVSEGDTVAKVLKRADQLMYMSKIAGRNCVTLGE